jgi:multidrug resistance efflux pump
MIEAEKFNQFDESSRQYATVRKLEDIEWKKEVESEEFKKAEADYIKKEQEWNRRMELAGFIMGNRDVDFEEWEEKREEAEMERQVSVIFC